MKRSFPSTTRDVPPTKTSPLTRRISTSLLALALATPLGIGVGYESSAGACHNVVTRTDRLMRVVVRSVERAERSLAQGNPRQALRRLRRVDRQEYRDALYSTHSNTLQGYQSVGSVGGTRPRAARPAYINQALINRIATIRSIATIRLGGNVRPNFRPGRLSPEQARQRIEEAVATLREFDTPVAQAYVAEGMVALSEDSRDAARTILAELAEADVLVDAFSWKLLGELSSEPATRERAETECEHRAIGAGRNQCALPRQDAPARS